MIQKTIRNAVFLSLLSLYAVKDVYSDTNNQLIKDAEKPCSSWNAPDYDQMFGKGIEQDMKTATIALGRLEFWAENALQHYEKNGNPKYTENHPYCNLKKFSGMLADFAAEYSKDQSLDEKQRFDIGSILNRASQLTKKVKNETGFGGHSKLEYLSMKY